MFNQIFQRFFSKTPKIFRIIRNIGLSVAGISATIIGAGLTIPDSILGVISQIGIVAGVVAAGISQLTTIWGVDENGKVIKQ
jgi:hypothetical protein